MGLLFSQQTVTVREMMGWLAGGALDMEKLEIGDAVELRHSATATRGIVVWVSDNGAEVKVKWEQRFGYQNETTTERAVDLRKLSG